MSVLCPISQNDVLAVARDMDIAVDPGVKKASLITMFPSL